MAVRWYVAYPLSYRNVEELLKERGSDSDHSAVQCWVVKYAPLLEEKFRNKHKRRPGDGARTRNLLITNPKLTISHDKRQSIKAMKSRD